MKLTVRGVRSVDIEMSQPERAAEFYSKIWNLTEVERQQLEHRWQAIEPLTRFSRKPTTEEFRLSAIRVDFSVQ